MACDKHAKNKYLKLYEIHSAPNRLSQIHCPRGARLMQMSTCNRIQSNVGNSSRSITEMDI